MGPFGRALALGGLLVVWVGARAALRKPIAHPFTVALAVAAGGTVAIDITRTYQVGSVWVYLGRLVAIASGITAALAFAYGVHRDGGGGRADRVRLLCYAVLTIAFGAFFAALPGRRGPDLMAITCSCVLLSSLRTLLRPPRRPAPLALAAAVIVYTACALAGTAARAQGGDGAPAGRAADLISIATFGVALVVYALDSVSAAVGNRRGAA